MKTPNEAVEKVGKGLRQPNCGGLLSIPRVQIGPLRAFYEVDFLWSSSRNLRKGFFYSLNAPGEGRERGILREASSGEAATSTDVLCPICHGERGWESCGSSTNYFWKECPDCGGTGKAKD